MVWPTHCIAVAEEQPVASRIGLIGGTGPEGRGLAARFARAGLEVQIGSRAQERGREAADEIKKLAGGKVRGGTNEEAIEGADILLVTVPYAGMRETLLSLASKIGDVIVVSAVVPLEFSRTRIAAINVPDGCAAQEAQMLLPQARVVGAFQNLSASHLLDIEHKLDGDVIVCADHLDALRATIELADMLPGIRGINGGPLANSKYVEEITALLLNINRLYKAETHIKIAGL
jgi:NADPH-dependent F420 reductase